MKINFGGKERGFQWGMGCLERYCDLMGCDVEGLEYAFTICQQQVKAASSLVFSAMVNYCELNNEPVDFRRMDVQVWIDEADQGTYNSIIDDFKKSKYLGKTIEDYFAMNVDPSDVDSKKKIVLSDIIKLSYKIGLKPREVKELTLLEFNMVLEGYMAREENEWDRTRNLMAFIATFAGMGATKVVNAMDLMPLYKDRIAQVKPIKSRDEALLLLNTFQVN